MINVYDIKLWRIRGDELTSGGLSPPLYLPLCAYPFALHVTWKRFRRAKDFPAPREKRTRYYCRTYYNAYRVFHSENYSDASVLIARINNTYETVRR
jgi:hypothetical protein